MSTSESNTTIQPTLAAQTAQISRKRSRILFGGSRDAASILVPSVDRTIHKASVARRIRMNYPVVPARSGVDNRNNNAGEEEDDEDENDGGKKKKESNTNGGSNNASLTSRVLAELKEDKLKQMRDGMMDAVDGNNKSGNSDTDDGQIVLHRETDLLNQATSNDANANANANAGNNHNSGILTIAGQTVIPDITNGQTSTSTSSSKPKSTKKHDGILVQKSSTKFTTTSVPKPTWHAPWQLTTVLSSHLGWVRSIAFSPTNDMFATGSADRTIKLFDFPKACVGSEDALKITLTGHINTVRGLAFSDRHPYLFSAGEDKMVKCWDLETNQVVRHYHGHLSGVFSLQLHPTLDVLVTGGRDAVARVWDMRTKHQVHCLTGHDNTVGTILTKGTDPQVITGSYDSTIKLWDLAAGKCMSTLTHHKKSVRALVQPSFENTFLSGAADNIKKWKGSDGRFIKNFSGHRSVINALAVNDDGVVVSGGDDGTMNFWDYATGYNFQKAETVAQPGSLDAENGIYVAQFDLTGTRLVTGEADKTIKIWKESEEASEVTHPVDMVGWKKKCMAEAKQRY